MSRSTNNQYKVPYPGGTITISPTGDDNNSGFDGDIASWDRFQEIIDTYDFRGGFVNVQIDIDAPASIYGESSTGIYVLSLSFNQDQTNNISFRQFNIVVLGVSTFDGCKIDFDLCNIVQFNTCTWKNNSGGSIFTYCRTVDLNFVFLENMSDTTPVFTIQHCDNIDASIISITNCDGCRFFEVSQSPININFSSAIPVGGVSGNARLVNLSTGFGDNPSSASNITYTENEPLLHKIFPTNTIDSGYEANTTINGTHLRGDYADNTAAATAGVKINHFYYNTTLGAISKRVP